MIDLINIEKKILVIRGQQVMIDRDLAEIYGYSTKAFNQQVKNNIKKFPEDMMFQLTKEEIEYNLRSKILTSSWGGSRYKPFAFTEQGIYMLMTILKGELATQQSIALVRLFKKMRHYFLENESITTHISSIENKIDTKFLEYDKNFSKIFDVINSFPDPSKQGIFFQGQIYDAYSFFQKLIQKAQQMIILVDNYIDLTVLDRFTQKNPNVNVLIYTDPNTKVKPLAVQKFNIQYPTLTINYTTTMHDRFLILDNTEIYHIGASIKDLGNKCFAFEQMQDATSVIQEVLRRI